MITPFVGNRFFPYCTMKGEKTGKQKASAYCVIGRFRRQEAKEALIHSQSLLL
jgi:hypothetical protein